MTAIPTSGAPRRRRSPRRAARTRPSARRSQQLTGPADLIQAIPYLLGFHPAASLVLVGLAGGRLAVTARLDLPGADEYEVVAHTIAALRGGGARHIVAVRYDDGCPLPEAGQDTVPVAVLESAAVGSGCDLRDVLVVSGGRWRSLRCDDESCCPPEGSPLPLAPSAFAAAATVDGIVALADRTALEGLLAPEAEENRARLAARLTAAVAAEGQLCAVDPVVGMLMSSARAADEGWPAGPPDDDDIVRLAAALRGIQVRDALWMSIDRGDIDGRELWREIARRAPAPYDAPALFLHGWASWRAGDGAFANIAAAQAVMSDPTYSAADLLQAALSRGIDPRTFPPLPDPRSA